jgi:hypothetical protein
VRCELDQPLALDVRAHPDVVLGGEHKFVVYNPGGGRTGGEAGLDMGKGYTQGLGAGEGGVGGGKCEGMEDDGCGVAKAGGRGGGKGGKKVGDLLGCTG